MEDEAAALQALERRQEELLDKISRVAALAGYKELSPELEELDARQCLLLERLRSFGLQTGLVAEDSAWQKQAQIFEEKLTSSKRQEEQCGDSGLSTRVSQPPVEVEQHLTKILQTGGVSEFRFSRVPQDYYGRSFQERRDLLGAASIFHLCKSIVMVNTQAQTSVKDCSDPKNSKYYVLVVQYCARLNAEKVRQFVYQLNDGRVPKKRFNLRLAPEEDSQQLTGFGHNAVTPIGMRTKIPVILSDAIVKLKPPFFWLGGGEVDLKLGISTNEFIQLVQPFITDCT